MRIYVIGRSSSADIVLVDASVAPRHAELIVTEDGRHHLTDCGSDGGSWIVGSSGGRTPIRQAFLESDETIALGDHRCTVRELLKSASRPGEEAAEAGWYGAPRHNAHARVERDPGTGEIIRKRP